MKQYAVIKIKYYRNKIDPSFEFVEDKEDINKMQAFNGLGAASDWIEAEREIVDENCILLRYYVLEYETANNIIKSRGENEINIIEKYSVYDTLICPKTDLIN